MIESRRTKMGWLLLVMLWFGLGVTPTQAASLGNVHVKSKLYEPFHAHIPLRSVRDFEALRVSMADEDAFKSVGLERPVLLSKFKLKVVGTGARRGYIHVTSHERVREPLLRFVVEAEFSKGVQRRHYDVLLDLKSY